VAVLVSPAEFLSTTFARRRMRRVRKSCRRARLLSLALTVARPVLPIRNDFRATLMSRAAEGRTMFALRVSTPLVAGLPNTRMVTTPLRLTDTDPKRAFAGAVGGGGGGGGGGDEPVVGGCATVFGSASAWLIAPTASTTPPEATRPLSEASGRAPPISAWTT